MQSSKKFTVYE